MRSNIINGGRFGLERETLRVTENGRMSLKPHPFENKQLSRDFCENQLEIITSVCDSIEEAENQLFALSTEAEQKLKEMNEFLWLYSNPPYIENESEIQIAQYSGNEKAKRDYRILLERRYGKKLMLYSGVHFNISFLTDLEKAESDKLYMKLLKYSMKYSWLIVLLTSASPVCDKSLVSEIESGSYFSGFSSMRNSRQGYWNKFIPVLDYSSVQEYCTSIHNYIDNGDLFSAGELYLPVRVKPIGENSLKNLSENGIDHIELRMFDINPLTETGTETKDLKFSYLLMVYFSSLPDFDFTEEMQINAVENHKKSAEYDLSDVKILDKPIFEAADEIIEDMKSFFFDDSDAQEILQFQQNKLKHGNRYAEIILHKYKDNYQELMIRKIKGDEGYV